MQTLLAHLQGYSAPRPGLSLLAANAAPENATILAANAAVAGDKLVVMQPDGLFVPFGTYWHETGWQQFDEVAANEIAANLAASPGGAAVYVGHPDEPGSDLRWPDKARKGRVSGCELADFHGAPGAKFRVAYNSKGRSIVEEGEYVFYSPRWDQRTIGRKDGARLNRPFRLLSIGLVPESNIPVPPVANEATVSTTGASATSAPQPEGGILMDPQIVALLGLDENATVEQALDAIAALQEQVKASQSEASAAQGQAEAEQVNAANERSARAVLIVDGAIRAGKLAVADRDAWLGKFESDFVAANSAVTTLRPFLPVGAGLNLAERNASAQEGENQGDVVAANSRAARIRSRAHEIAANERIAWAAAFRRAEQEGAGRG